MTNPDSRQLSGWAAGGIGFAAAMLLMIGTFEIITGLAAIINDDFFVRAPHYTYHLDVTTWGVIHLLLGVLLLTMGIGLVQGQNWAAIGAIAVAILSAIANFFFIPYYPFWSILIIAIAVWVIWSLTRPGAVVER